MRSGEARELVGVQCDQSVEAKINNINLLFYSSSIFLNGFTALPLLVTTSADEFGMARFFLRIGCSLVLKRVRGSLEGTAAIYIAS